MMMVMMMVISELRSVTCHMGSHNITCHPKHSSEHALTTARGRYFYLPRRDGRL